MGALVVLIALIGGPSNQRPAETRWDPSIRTIDAGNALFTKVWTSGDGVGPLANALSCAACHSTPRVGGSGGSNREATVLLSKEGHDPSGGRLFRQLLIRPGRAVVRRPLPRAVSRRRPPSLFGLGLLEQVSIENGARRSSGRVPVGGGRFGWKARFRTIDEFVAAALINELGLSNPVFLDDGAASPRLEVSAAQVSALADFVRGLPPPPRKTIAGSATGARLFSEIGCSTCHLPRLRAASQWIEPYTDLLLHDMGSALADDFSDGGATGREFRTPPLWGVSESGPPFLHDGRARSLDEAIRLHDGDALSARTAYERLPAPRRRAVLLFLQSL